MPRTVFMYVLLVSLLIASCGQSTALEPLNTPTTEAPASTLPAPGSEWTINMNHSGGIMGLMRSIEISSDGKLHYLKIYRAFPEFCVHSMNPGQVVTDGRTFFKIAASGGFILLKEVQQTGRKTMQIGDFLRGFVHQFACTD